VPEEAREWERRVEAHFGFLPEHGFRFDHVDDRWWATSAVYLSPSLGVAVTRNMEFDRVELQLLRLVEGRPPEVEIWLTDRPLNSVLFDNVLTARAPNGIDSPPTGLSDDAVEEQLRRWAELLRSVAPDFLDGSDAAIVDAEQAIRQRVGDDPQELTIWLPSDASDQDEVAAREKAERSAPSNVRVVVRRYKR
jgi:hypothetical protein